MKKQLFHSHILSYNSLQYKLFKLAPIKFMFYSHMPTSRAVNIFHSTYHGKSMIQVTLICTFKPITW